MREIRLKEIQDVCNSPAGLKIKRQAREEAWLQERKSKLFPREVGGCD